MILRLIIIRNDLDKSEKEMCTWAATVSQFFYIRYLTESFDGYGWEDLDFDEVDKKWLFANYDECKLNRNLPLQMNSILQEIQLSSLEDIQNNINEAKSKDIAIDQMVVNGEIVACAIGPFEMDEEEVEQGLTDAFGRVGGGMAH